MSDAGPSSSDFSGMDAGEDLIFDERRPVSATPAEAEAPNADLGLVRGRGRMSKNDAASQEHVPASAAPIVSAGAVRAAAEEPADAPTPFLPQGANPAGSKSSASKLLLATVALALVTSATSLGGLITVSRTLKDAGADRARAAAEREALAEVPVMIAHLEKASARLDSASTRLPATVTPSSPIQAITLTDLHHEIDGLKLSLAQHQPQGLGALDDMTRDRFAELMTKVARLGEAVDQLAKREAAGAGSPQGLPGNQKRRR